MTHSWINRWALPPPTTGHQRNTCGRHVRSVRSDMLTCIACERPRTLFLKVSERDAPLYNPLSPDPPISRDSLLGTHGQKGNQAQPVWLSEHWLSEHRPRSQVVTVQFLVRPHAGSIPGLISVSIALSLILSERNDSCTNITSSVSPVRNKKLTCQKLGDPLNK